MVHATDTETVGIDFIRICMLLRVECADSRYTIQKWTNMILQYRERVQQQHHQWVPCCSYSTRCGAERPPLVALAFVKHSADEEYLYRLSCSVV